MVKEAWTDGRAGTTGAMLTGGSAEDAIMGREHETQLGCGTTDGGLRFDEVDLHALPGQIQSGAHATYTGPDHHDRIMAFDERHALPPGSAWICDLGHVIGLKLYAEFWKNATACSIRVKRLEVYIDYLWLGSWEDSASGI